MTEEMMRNVPEIKGMLEQGELLSSELTEIWKAAPKFPQVEAATDDKIDVDSFIQVYRDIDDLFEGDDEGETEAEASNGVDVVETAPTTDEDEVDEGLKQAFATLTDGKTISFYQLKQWEEITSLIAEGALGEDEFLTLWETSVGVRGKDINLDLEGFVKFNNALDELFEFDDEELEEIIVGEVNQEDEVPAQATVVALPTITEEDLPPGVLFSQLANENYLVGKQELARWGELNDMMKEGDLTTYELNTLFDSAAKAPGTSDMLDEDGFCGLYDAIDSLFEDDDAPEAAEQKPDENELKEELLELLVDISKLQEEQGLQMCGMDCSEEEQERVVEVVSELEREPYNQVLSLTSSGSGAIQKQELVGTWDLLYSSSSTMKYNEGLSGLAGGLTKFGGLQQQLSATKYLSDVEYTEQVISKLGGKPLEVKIKGDWDLRTEISLFTGKPSNILFVTPDKVYYGPRQDKADHWKSLGPMNLLVLSYLDEDLRIMRGNTSTDTLVIWRRSK